MKKPIIAISVDATEDTEVYSYSEFPWYALRTDYSNAIAQHGGFPILVPLHEENIDDILELADGILIPGGDVDVDPSFYGQEVKHDNVAVIPARTDFDLKFIAKVLEKEIPFLGICYGQQLLNVHTGGTLIQHIPAEYETDINHYQPSPKNIEWHGLTIEENTKLLEIAGGRKEWEVNSTHHQAVDETGDDMLISARASDGIIEAIELKDHPFCIGVEWHPEYQKTELDRNLFKAFVDAAKAYGGK